MSTPHTTEQPNTEPGRATAPHVWTVSEYNRELQPPVGPWPETYATLEGAKVACQHALDDHWREVLGTDDCNTLEWQPEGADRYCGYEDAGDWNATVFYVTRATTPAPAPRDGAIANASRTNPHYRCYDCGSTIPGHHTACCDMTPKGSILDLPAIRGTQWWTGELPPSKQASVQDTDGTWLFVITQTDPDDSNGTFAFRDVYRNIGAARKAAEEEIREWSSLPVFFRPDPERDFCWLMTVEDSSSHWEITRVLLDN